MCHQGNTIPHHATRLLTVYKCVNVRFLHGKKNYVFLRLALQCEHIKGCKDSLKATKRSNTQSEHLLSASHAPCIFLDAFLDAYLYFLRRSSQLGTKAEIRISPALQVRTLGRTEANLPKFIHQRVREYAFKPKPLESRACEPSSTSSPSYT